jgi:hypothetical protein
VSINLVIKQSSDFYRLYCLLLPLLLFRVTVDMTFRTTLRIVLGGLGQERAFVTGLLAANLVVERLGSGLPAVILDTEADEPHIEFAKSANRLLKSTLTSFGMRSPFL